MLSLSCLAVTGARCAGGVDGASTDSCRSGIPFECDVACSQALLPFMSECFNHARNMDRIHRDLYNSLQMECELMEFAPHVHGETGHRLNPKTEALLPVAPCDRDTLGDRLTGISDVCCIRGALDCSGVVPDTCSRECAAVFLPFWAQCATDFADYFFGVVDVPTLNRFAGSCADMHGESLHSEALSIGDDGAVGSDVSVVIEHRPCQAEEVVRRCSQHVPVGDACDTPCMQSLVLQFEDCMASTADLQSLLHPLTGAVDVCRALLSATGGVPVEVSPPPPPPPPPSSPQCADDPHGVIAAQGYTCDELVTSVAAYGGCQFQLSPTLGIVAHHCPARCRAPGAPCPVQPDTASNGQADSAPGQSGTAPGHTGH